MLIPLFQHFNLFYLCRSITRISFSIFNLFFNFLDAFSHQLAILTFLTLFLNTFFNTFFYTQILFKALFCFHLRLKSRTRKKEGKKRRAVSANLRRLQTGDSPETWKSVKKRTSHFFYFFFNSNEPGLAYWKFFRLTEANWG